MPRITLLLLLSFLSFLLIQCGADSFESGQDIQEAGLDAISVEKPSPEAQQSLNKFMAFKGDLQKRLIGAIQKEGAPHAIQVCSIASPEMEEKHSESGWQIYRVSDKPRNPDHRANEFEAAVLDLWKNRMAENKPLSPVQFRTVDAEYVMSPIPIQAALCLQCHGGADDIKPETRTVIENLYPDDEATGYKLNEIRGAFVSKREMK